LCPARPRAAAGSAGWRQEIGARQYDAMKQALRDLGRDSFEL
jgi:hypothetical protein